MQEEATEKKISSPHEIFVVQIFVSIVGTIPELSPAESKTYYYWVVQHSNKKQTAYPDLPNPSFFQTADRLEQAYPAIFVLRNSHLKNVQDEQYLPAASTPAAIRAVLGLA